MRYTLIVVLLGNISCIKNTQSDETGDYLLKLTKFALENRQNFDYYKKPNLYKPGYYPGNFLYRPQFPRPNNYYQEPQNVMEILFTINKNDKLHCIPRLLCEVTSDTLSNRRQSIDLSNLPININMESIIRLLSIMGVGNNSPYTAFGKAILLGYVSKGKSESCLDAYPECPRSADKLIAYLNNYNGGFFRYFAGIKPQTNPGNYGLINYPPQYLNYNPYYNNNNDNKNNNEDVVAEQRIQNKPIIYISNGHYNNENLLFTNRKQKTFVFPVDYSNNNDNELNGYRKPKELPYPLSYYTNELDYQKPLPNHQAIPMIFPDRTGTGELRLDPDELNDNYKHSQLNFQNNNLISFNPLPSNEAYNADGTRNGRPALFTFPV